MSSNIDLSQLARVTMTSYGFLPRFTSGALKEAKVLEDNVALVGDPLIRDLRFLPWSSIDNEDSRDLDQVAFCQEMPHDEIRIQVGIADVDHYVKKDSAIDRHASKNATSVYTGVETFPMLPEQLSTNLSSLNPGTDRLAVVIDFVVDKKGSVHSGQVYRAFVHNHAKLVYEPVGYWLEGKAPIPAEVRQLPGLEAQIRLQDKASQRLQKFRHRRGAQEFETIEVVPVIVDGQVVDLQERHENRAHHLIENFMIAANGVMAGFIKKKGYPLIQRVVRTPERWPRIRELALSLGEKLPHRPDAKALADFLEKQKMIHPEQFPDISLAVIKLLGKAEYAVTYPQRRNEGHFGLAVEDYAHSTAPNRRFVDLIVQRLLKNVLLEQPSAYSHRELENIASWCTDRDQAAKKVERFMHKVAAALFLKPRVGEVFEGIVTGASEKGTYVRLIDPPAEGKVVRGFFGMDVGDKVKVRLILVDPARGFIDFQGLGSPVKRETVEREQHRSPMRHRERRRRKKY